MGARWEGRNTAKDRVRHLVWQRLEEAGVGIGPCASRIPNFVGADLAADRLSEHERWASASTVKCNPDPGQAWVRLAALQQGKLLFAPVPELTAAHPFVRIDPVELSRRGIRFEAVMFSEGFVEVGRAVDFDEIPHLDVAVAGCVAVTRQGARLGKGGGFADLEFGIFHQLGTVDADTLVATTVHPLQIVADGEIEMLAHDTPLDLLATPTDLIETSTPFPVPTGVDWSQIQPDQLRDIPFLEGLRTSLLQ